MIAVFYSVESIWSRDFPEGYDLTQKEDCIKIFKELIKDPDTLYYDMCRQDYRSRVKGYNEFMQDFNDEFLDYGGYWCLMLQPLTTKDIEEIL